MDAIIHKRLDMLIEAEKSLASVLFFFGIDFNRQGALSLAEACAIKGIKIEPVANEMRHAMGKTGVCDEIARHRDYPVGAIIASLKTKHKEFLRKRIPFLQQLIFGLPKEMLCGANAELIADLQVVFPLFAEDFIRHVFEEEETLFSYIMLLDEVQRKRTSSHKAFYWMEKNSMAKFAYEHKTDDDEMSRIRELTKGYELKAGDCIGIKVLYYELQAFEDDLKTHAAIENRILFPKAIRLEAGVKKQLASLIALN